MTSMTADDNLQEKKLLRLIAGGNQIAFKQVYDRYYVRIFHFAKKYLRSEHLAEEAVQDVFLKLWEKREKLVHVEDFSPWLFRLSRNYLLNILTRASNENRIKEEIKKTLNDTSEHEDTPLIEKERTDLLWELISMLPSQRRQIFTLCHLEEKSYEETARMMGISKSTVNDHMVKAMKYLKNNFSKKISE